MIYSRDSSQEAESDVTVAFLKRSIKGSQDSPVSVLVFTIKRIKNRFVILINQNDDTMSAMLMKGTYEISKTLGRIGEPFPYSVFLFRKRQYHVNLSLKLSVKGIVGTTEAYLNYGVACPFLFRI